MIRINLLPVKKTQQHEVALRQALLAAAGLIVVAVACGYLYFEIDRKVEAATTQNEQLQQEIEQLKQVIGKVEEFEAKKAELEKKLGIIQTLKSNKTGPVHMLDEIATNIPEKCWLTSISEKNKKVEITGVAINNEVIADFISKLEASDYFDDLYLVSTVQTESKDGLKLKEFSANARMTTPEEKNAAKAQAEAASAAAKAPSKPH